MSDPLKKILDRTLKTVEDSKEEIFSIAESNRTEVSRITQELYKLHIDVNDVIKATDEQRTIEKQLRQKLMEVNRDFKLYSETDMQDTYKETTEAQIKLQLLESKEQKLRTRRDNLERSLNQMQATIERAESLLSHISFTISLLQGEIVNATSSSKTMQRQEISLRIIKAQEDERRRVAREIHDGPAQTLANIVLRLEIAERLLELSPQKAKIELEDLKNLVRANLQDIRRIIFDLRPMALDDLGIVQAINQYLKNFQLAYSIKCELHINGPERRLPQAVEVSLFRLLQESLTNIAKHSRSERALIDFHFRDKSTTVKVIDFGKGFNVENSFQLPGEHYGLIGMRERIEMFSGLLVIHSSPGKGTTIDITIPY
ncbi:MAG TPA: sensor histidine kinase [Desulfitobacteriaceae bacterium]|nr:sensor histidine kinase [Desulfitobacteriaceae bacterium]